MGDMTISEASTPDVVVARRKRRWMALAAAVLAFANILGLFLNILWVVAWYQDHESTNYLVPQDIWAPFIVVAWAQAVVNGLVLSVWKRTRVAGVGVLLGAAVATVVFFAWLMFFVAPYIE